MFRTLIFLWKQEKCDVPSTKSFSQWSPRICAPIYEQWNACEMGTFQWKIAYIMLKPLLQSHRKWVGRVGKDVFVWVGYETTYHMSHRYWANFSTCTHLCTQKDKKCRQKTNLSTKTSTSCICVFMPISNKKSWTESFCPPRFCRNRKEDRNTQAI